mmetsp:Transcript_13702/g.58546  ORF Transcript_13702/g.58546 Transcript_13702/m.58546 type:complete len:202 (-) Transcript_13702:764-1369(-)
MSDSATPAPSIPTTTASDASVEISNPPNPATILHPTKPSTAATAVCRYSSSATITATNAKRLRKPKMANMLLEYTMNGSCVTPNTAGMESTANTTSESSMTHRHNSKGVAILIISPVFSSRTVVKKLSPSYPSDTGKTLEQNLTMAFSDMSSSSSSSSVMSLYEEKIRTPANTNRTGLKFVTASYPATIIAARIAMAPPMP